MISYDFEYHKPTSISEATHLYQSLQSQGKKPMYYCGGTEILTLGRVNRIVTGAIIDIKGILDCNVLKLEENLLIMGVANTLTKLNETNYFPLLSKTIIEIADHTARNKITLGGNICANIFYREAVLPLLLTDSQVVIASPNGVKVSFIHEVFHQTLNLNDGEFLVQVKTDNSYFKMPYVSVKRRRQWDIGYPLITVAAIKNDNEIRVAFSGLCSFPFRSQQIEQSLNNRQISRQSRIDQVINDIPAPILDDVHGSAEYRLFVLKYTLNNVLDALEGERHA